MPISDIYNVDSGLVNVGTTTTTPILLLSTTANKRAWIVGVRVAVGNTATAAGNNVLFTVARPGNTPSGGTAVSTRAHDASAPSSLASATIGNWGTAPTVGNILWEMELPQTSGSGWEEFPPTGYEWGIPISGSVAGFVTASSATTTPVSFQYIFSE